MKDMVRCIVDADCDEEGNATPIWGTVAVCEVHMEEWLCGEGLWDRYQ